MIATEGASVHGRLASRSRPSVQPSRHLLHHRRDALQTALLPRAPEALDALRDSLFSYAARNDCWLQAWALFSNHYHLVVECARGEQIARMLYDVHKNTAIEQNERNSAKGRRVWYQYRDTQLTNERSWLARLRYTHENAVHHRLVLNAENYPWCSAAWFSATARRSFVETVKRVKIDRVKVYDDFGPVYNRPESGD